MAKLGFGMLLIMQNEWPKAAEDIDRFRADRRRRRASRRAPPIILTNVSCAESRDEAQERAMQYLGRKWDSIDNHYHFSDGHLADVKGYESYGKMAKTYAKMKDATILRRRPTSTSRSRSSARPTTASSSSRELRG